MKSNGLIAVALAMLVAQSVAAHTELKATVPADRAAIAAAPENVQLTFSEAVRLTALSIQKDGAEKQSLGPLPAETTAAFAVALPATLAAGHYVVTWRALSEDTHVISGEFMFTLGAEGGQDAHAGHGAAPAPAAHADHGGTN
jgi:methionine-rich copper-binding protein CopC